MDRGGSAELRETHRLVGHADRAWALAWSPNPGAGAGPVLASCGADKTVRIWKRAPDGAWHCSDVLEGVHERTVRSCAWSPDGKLLVDASFDGTAAIWEYSGEDFELVDTLEGHLNEVKSVSWNQSGSMIATCSRDRAAWIWEILPGNEHECVDVLEGHTEDVKMVQWHPFFDVLVSVSYDNTIRVWADDGDGKWPCVQTLTEAGNSGHSSTVWSISFNQKGDRMVTCSDDCTLKIWDTSIDLSQPTIGEGHDSWRHISTLSGYHGRTIFSVHWSSEDVIASGAGDNAICLFAEENMQVEGPSYRLILKKEKAHDMDVNCVRWCPQDPRVLASASDDGTVKLWELRGDILD
ncbi:protein CIA1 isoform X1 [Triticum aestivum]|uniref:protein CIA1 isoform X1 n=1 Tax=Triticum aestivum TaxID=4565 RepID=UPI001D02D769|nr:protein CIA1-like isoform X1 [Triticum aestivum]